MVRWIATKEEHAQKIMTTTVRGPAQTDMVVDPQIGASLKTPIDSLKQTIWGLIWGTLILRWLWDTMGHY